MAVLMARMEKLEVENAALKAAKVKKVSSPYEAKKPILTKKVFYERIPKNARLRFVVGTKAKNYGTHYAVFKNEREVLPVAGDIQPADAKKPFFTSINAFATVALKRHQEAMGRKSASINVYDESSNICFLKDGEWVKLSTIQEIVREGDEEEEAAPAAPPAAVGGGGSAAAAAAPSAEEEDIPASQGSIIKNCDKCGMALEEDEEHECEATNANIVEMELNGIATLYNPVSHEVRVKNADGLPGVKISEFDEELAKHDWVWKPKPIGKNFFLINHFNYMKSKDGVFQGIYDPATKQIVPTELVPEDF